MNTLSLLSAISKMVEFSCQCIDPDLVRWVQEFLTAEKIDSLELGQGKVWFSVSLSDCGRVVIIEELPPAEEIIPFVEVKE